jgi:hypothetical protein
VGAAIGWGATSRSWSTQPGLGSAIIAAVALAAFATVNLASLQHLYGRVNAALELARRSWPPEKDEADAQAVLLREFPFSLWQFAALDAAAAVGLFFLLSRYNLGPILAGLHS